MQNPPDSKIAIIGLPSSEVKLGKRYGAFGFGQTRSATTLRAHGKHPPVPCGANPATPHEAGNGRL